jgi:hypothetical protein
MSGLAERVTHHAAAVIISFRVCRECLHCCLNASCSLVLSVRSGSDCDARSAVLQCYSASCSSEFLQGSNDSVNDCTQGYNLSTVLGLRVTALCVRCCCAERSLHCTLSVSYTRTQQCTS